jgi:WD40 repeat protein
MSEIVELAPNAKWVHEKSAEVQIKQITGHADSIVNCQLFKNSETIFTVSNDNTARLWDFSSGKELHVYSDLHDKNQPIPRGKLNDDNTKYLKNKKSLLISE